ncbi:hypothetical protein GWI33_011283, partial [Rhynchophorus ferrugineus]
TCLAIRIVKLKCAAASQRRANVLVVAIHSLAAAAAYSRPCTLFGPRCRIDYYVDHVSLISTAVTRAGMLEPRWRPIQCSRLASKEEEPDVFASNQLLPPFSDSALCTASVNRRSGF